MDFINQIMQYGISDIASLLGVVAMTAAMVSLTIRRFFDSDQKIEKIQFVASNNIEIDSRLREVKTEFDRSQKSLRWSTYTATFLTFSQFVVGGVLASSFIQESLTPNLVGLLGVLVLLASLIHQKYRPDLHAAQARHRLFKTRKLIRAIEDDLFSITSGMLAAPTIFEVRQKASIGLAELEDIELEGKTTISSHTASNTEIGQGSK